MSRLYARIAHYYLEGYGMPRQFYSDEQLKRFWEKGELTEKEFQALQKEKRRKEGGEHGG